MHRYLFGAPENCRSLSLSAICSLNRSLPKPQRGAPKPATANPTRSRASFGPSAVGSDRVKRCSKTVAIRARAVLNLPSRYAKGDAKDCGKILQQGLQASGIERQPLRLPSVGRSRRRQQKLACKSSSAGLNARRHAATQHLDGAQRMIAIEQQMTKLVRQSDASAAIRDDIALFEIGRRRVQPQTIRSRATQSPQPRAVAASARPGPSLPPPAQNPRRPLHPRTSHRLAATHAPGHRRLRPKRQKRHPPTPDPVRRPRAHHPIP